VVLLGNDPLDLLTAYDDAVASLTARFERLLERPAWHDAGACRTVTEVDFFPRRGASTAAARATCAGCPVRVDCAAYGLEREELGIWGGTTERQRQRAREAGWSVEQLLAVDQTDELDVAALCTVCGDVCDSVHGRGRCKTCSTNAKRAASRRANAFRADRDRRRARGGKPLPPWGIESHRNRRRAT
jgi:WhiB family redox-sensing transcriptional regulator